MPDPRQRRTDEERRREADRILDRTSGESELLGTSSLARAARRLERHMAAGDADQSDRIEIWGTRVGRALAVVFVVALLILMAGTYL